ncbi:MAG TPA: hypothetical protein VFG29_12025 [Syntrophales bacterium]|nr:hypothetical protein [Syntrophales bacterium]
MFQKDVCDYCGECLNSCRYLDFDRESGGKEFKKLVQGEKVAWLKDCVTCIACNEYCLNAARPFDLILKRLEEDGSFTDPILKAQMAERFKPEGEPRSVAAKDRLTLHPAG